MYLKVSVGSLHEFWAHEKGVKSSLFEIELYNYYNVIK